MAHRGGRYRRIVAVALTFALLANVVQIAPAAAAVPEPKPVRRELEDKRTAFSRTWDNGDGTRTFETYFEPLHFRDLASGAWLPIDTSLEETLTPTGRGLRTARTRSPSCCPTTSARAT